MNNLLRKIFNTTPHWGWTIVRLVVGIVFVAHGSQKFFSYGIDGVADGFAKMGLPMPYVNALLASSAEFFGGIAMILGLLTRLAAIPMAFTMIVAFATVHAKNGFFLPTGFEYVFVLFFIFVALFIEGAGPLSVDGLIAKKLNA